MISSSNIEGKKEAIANKLKVKNEAERIKIRDNGFRADDSQSLGNKEKALMKMKAPEDHMKVNNNQAYSTGSIIVQPQAAVNSTEWVMHYNLKPKQVHFETFLICIFLFFMMSTKIYGTYIVDKNQEKTLKEFTAMSTIGDVFSWGVWSLHCLPFYNDMSRMAFEGVIKNDIGADFDVEDLKVWASKYMNYVGNYP